MEASEFWLRFIPRPLRFPRCSIPWPRCLQGVSAQGELPARDCANCKEIVRVIAEGWLKAYWGEGRGWEEIWLDIHLGWPGKKESTRLKYDRVSLERGKEISYMRCRLSEQGKGNEVLKLKWQVQKASEKNAKQGERTRDIMGFIFLLQCNVFTQELFAYRSPA